ncbi:MAG TPA: SIMPL domain-containing protein [Draconibacterium sp.]|jgi:uncharacterized protein|nr:SIMPL domain-containing protein [Draconibacterium sp.]
MKNVFILFLLMVALAATSQNKETERLIEVNGKAEMEIQPDEIVFIIGIEEYWKEEFEKKKDFEDYKTKIPLAEIEDALIKNLRKVGIEKDDIKVKSMGNYWRYKGKEFLYSKQFEIKITDLAKINQLTQIQDAKGIKYMNIGQLNHSKMDEFKKAVKINALKDAREKAAYLVESIGSQLGEVVTISELSDSYYQPMRAESMMMMAKSADMAGESIDEVQNIKLEYQVRAVFRIK